MNTNNDKQQDKIKHNKKATTINFENKRLSISYFLPLLLIAGFVPLITYAKYLNLKGTTQALYWTGQQEYLDFFSYWKARWIIILTAIALVIYIVLLLQKKLPFKNLKQYYIPLGIYAVFAVASTFVAKDSATALWGFVDMGQGMFVLISYVLITFLAINFVNNERDVSLFSRVFIFLIIVEGILGIGQYFGHDFFQTGFGKSLIVPADISSESLSFTFGPKTIYATFFNTNFVGSFATLMLPLSLSILMLSKAKSQKILASISVILSLFLWIGCNSRAGYLGVAFSALFALWLFRKFVIKHWKISAGLLVALVVMVIGLNAASGGALAARIKTLNVAEQIKQIKTENENSLKFEDIVLGKDSFSIKTSNETLNFKIADNKLYFLDENNNELNINTNDNQITINDPKYSGYLIIMQKEYSGVTVNAYGKTINFYISQDGVKIIGSGSRLTEQISSPFFEPLRGLETMGSNRGYEWGATIPMLKNYMMLGAGPDNFPIVFNQDDFIAKLNLIGFDANIVVDKPHNMYLQIAINTGVISLLALLALWGIYIVSSLKLYYRADFTSSEEIMGAACMIAVIGYLTAAIFNDSVNSVAPIFWLILGMGISINLRVKSRRENASHIK